MLGGGPQQTRTAETEAAEPTAPASSRGAPEIDRAQLRSMLVQALPHGTVRWGWRLETLLSEPLPSPPNGKLEPAPPSHSLHFDNARTLPGFDLVVGADGAWSRVRPHLAPFASTADHHDSPSSSFLTDGATAASAAKPVYAGLAGFSCSIPDAARTAPGVYELVNRGSLFSFSDGKTLMGQQLGDGSIWVGASSVKGEDWVDEQQQRERLYRQQQQQHEQGAPTDDAAARQPQDRYRVGPWFKACVRAEYKDWAPELLQLIEASDDDSARLRPIYVLPIGFREGVNLAMEDALKLSRAIIAALKTPTTNDQHDTEQSRLAQVRRALADNVAEYEQDMFVRSHVIQTVSVGMMQAMFFTPGAPRSSIHTYISSKAWQVRPLLYPLVAVVVYVYFAIWKLFN